MDVGVTQDFLTLQMALAPCLLGYSEIAARLNEEPKMERNPYLKWIENYITEDFRQAVVAGRGVWFITLPARCRQTADKTNDAELLEKHASDMSPTRIERLVGVFIRTTEVGQETLSFRFNPY